MVLSLKLWVGGADYSRESSEVAEKEGVVPLAEVSALFMESQSECLGRLDPNFDNEQLWSFGVEI